MAPTSSLERSDRSTFGDRGARRDHGLLDKSDALSLRRASLRSRPLPVRMKAQLAYFLRGERPEPIPSVLMPVEETGATGVCCSGGGIRSAAYNLGALQALQRADRLQSADYLAAVSGGSYIAAAYSMVAKTGQKRLDGTTERADSDPELIERVPPFAPGSPEEQYLRNRSSYMAPDGSAKVYLACRVLLGLGINLLFLALPLVALTILAGVGVYGPLYGDGLEPPIAAYWIPGIIFGCGVLVAAACVLRRPPNDGLRRASEVWCSRLLVGGALVAVVTLVIPLLAGVDLDPTPSLSTQTVGAGAGGVAGLMAGVIACARELFAKPRKAADELGRARGWIAKQAPHMRRALVLGAAAVAGPLLLLTVAVATLSITAESVDTDTGLLLLAAAGLLAAFTALYAAADLTSWSLHPFYKRRLCTAFALKRVRPADDERTRHRAVIKHEDEQGIAVERDFDHLVALSKTALPNGPTLIVCAAANVSDPGATPPGRRVTSFTFSAHTIGGPLVGALPTEEFEDAFDGHHGRRRDLTLPAAVAMSGAAISPSSGKMGSRSLTFLMTLANMRLGVWVPNPRWVAGSPARERSRYKRPRPWYLFLELLGRNRLDARYLYVSDGGHYENLGLVELLRRGCTTIYCFDASGGHTFSALGDAVALARSELGVEIDIDPKLLMSDGEPLRADTNAIRARFAYPNGDEGVLVYARNVVSPGAPWDVQAHQLAEPRFPNDSTLDQLYTDQQFESYRVLGERAGERAIELVDEPAVHPRLVAA